MSTCRDLYQINLIAITVKTTVRQSTDRQNGVSGSGVRSGQEQSVSKRTGGSPMARLFSACGPMTHVENTALARTRYYDGEWSIGPNDSTINLAHDFKVSTKSTDLRCVSIDFPYERDDRFLRHHK